MTSEAGKRASAKYDENFWRAKIRFPKELETKIKQVAQEAGMSVNQYIIEAVDEKMNK